MTLPVGDVLRIVTLSNGGRPVEVLNLNDGLGYARQRDADFTFTPAASSVRYSSTARRYGGARAVGQTHDNASVAWTCYVKGTTEALARTNVEALLSQIAEVGRGRYIEWAPGTGKSSFFELAGPGDWQPAYQVRQFSEVFALSVQLTFPVLPLVQWSPMTILDDFSVDSITDYSVRASPGTLAVSGGQLVPSSTSSKIWVHTARGYSYEDTQVTLKLTTGATTPSSAGLTGPILKWLDDSNYIYVALRYDGSLRLIKRVAGTETLLTSAAVTVAASTSYWVRARINGNVFVAEQFTSAPTPMATPAGTATTTLAGGDATQFGVGVGGGVGFRFLPLATDERIDDFAVQPYVYRNQTLPQTIQLGGSIPGDAPALADVTVTPSGGTTAPAFGMIAWAPRAGTAVSGVAPFGIIEAESAGDLSGWVSAANGSSRGGNRLIDATVSGAETYTASWTIDPSTLVPDDFTAGELLLELWAVVVVNSTLVSPKLTASVRPVDGLNFGAERFTLEWGSAGKLLTIPSSGEKRRMTRLGTILVEANSLKPRAVKLWLAGSTAIGSTGTFGVDYLMPVLARSRALSPTGEALDTSYPRFVISTSETSKMIRADLSGAVAAPPNNTYPDHGLGGNLIELPEGQVDMLVKLSSLVPDDPTVDTTDEQLAHSATVSVAPVPRSFMLRS